MRELYDAETQEARVVALHDLRNRMSAPDVSREYQGLVLSLTKALCDALAVLAGPHGDSVEVQLEVLSALIATTTDATLKAVGA